MILFGVKQWSVGTYMFYVNIQAISPVFETRLLNQPADKEEKICTKNNWIVLVIFKVIYVHVFTMQKEKQGN